MGVVNAEAKLSYVTVQTAGTGKSVKSATDMAISEAIAQIHGKSIDSQQLMIETEASVSQGDQEQYSSSSAYGNQIATRTKGTVSSYKILSQHEDENGLWHVSVSSQVAKYNVGSRASRKRIALLQAKTKESAFTVASEKFSGAALSNIVTTELSNFLVQSRKFAILDRQNEAAIKKELAIATSDDTSIDEMARLGNKLVADYVLISSIEDITFNKIQKKSRLSDRTFYVGNGSLKLGFRLVDSATGEIVFANTVAPTITMDDLSQSNGLSTGQAAVNRLSMLASKEISKLILDQVFPVAVVKVSGDHLILSQGGNSLKEAQRYSLYLLGDKIIDPYTKESLGREEKPIGVIEITRVTPKQSYASVISKSVNLNEVFKPKRLVLREQIRSSASKDIEPILLRKANNKQVDDEW